MGENLSSQLRTGLIDCVRNTEENPSYGSEWGEEDLARGDNFICRLWERGLKARESQLRLRAWRGSGLGEEGGQGRGDQMGERISVADWPPTRGAVSPLALHIQHRYIRAENMETWKKNLETLREAKKQSDTSWRHILCLVVLISERGMLIGDSHDNPVSHIFTRLQ